jgi:hypothetical protein
LDHTVEVSVYEERDGGIDEGIDGRIDGGIDEREGYSITCIWRVERGATPSKKNRITEEKLWRNFVLSEFWEVENSPLLFMMYCLIQRVASPHIVNSGELLFYVVHCRK